MLLLIPKRLILKLVVDSATLELLLPMEASKNRFLGNILYSAADKSLNEIGEGKLFRLGVS